MSILLLIFGLTFAIHSISAITEITDGWCTQFRPVTKSRLIYKTREVEVTRRRFWGTIQHRVEPITYSSIEVFWDHEIEYECCEGYVQNGTECKPICADNCPKYNWCSKPNVCTCVYGYEMKDGFCEPICHNACPQFSNCTEPEKCDCFTGYKMENNICQPICESHCPEFAECVAPGKCDCWHGYEMKSVDNVLNCMPICTQACPASSICTKPDMCECEAGYAMNANSTECQPVCLERCPEHSVCYRPNECLCTDGYSMQHLPDIQPHCSPICSQNCSAYGKCIAPNTCACLPGYRMHQPLSQSEGNNETIICEPICSGNCTNGFCFRPELCVCKMGYLMGPNNICSPVCSLGCVNAECIEPEICSCLPGFQFTNNSVHHCVPQCEPQCVNGNCAAPNVCICWHNYQPNVTHFYPQSRSEMDALTMASNACIPTCTQKCINGICVAPNICRCINGYKVIKNPSFVGSENHCEPFCEGCSHGGDCVAPNICKCWPGFAVSEMENSTQRCQQILNAFVDQSTTDTALTFDMTSTTNTAMTFGNKFDESTTDKNEIVAERRNTLSELFYPPNLATNTDCLTDCKCWVQDDELGVLSNAICEHICNHTNDDTECLDLRKCKCENVIWTIICNSSTIDSSEDDDDSNRYICKEAINSPHIMLSTPATNTITATVSKPQRDNNFIQYLYWIVGGITCSTLCVALLLYYRHKMRNARREQYNSNNIEGELCVLGNNCEVNENYEN